MNQKYQWTLPIHKSVKQFGHSFAFNVPTVWILFLVRFMHPPLLPLSERSLKPTSTPRDTHLSLNFLLVFSVVLDLLFCPSILKLVDCFGYIAP